MKSEEIVIVNCSGRGDKDADQAAACVRLEGEIEMRSMTGYGRGETIMLARNSALSSIR